MKKLIFCLLLTVSGLIAYGQTVKLSREKQILLLHNVDSLIYHYEFYSTLSEGNRITGNQIEKFLTLFLSDSVVVFDDINPNYINNNETTINEKVKKVSEYVKDVNNNFTSLFSRIVETDAGTLFNRLKFGNKGSLIVNVRIRKEIQANSKTAEGARFETFTYQNLVLQINDTIQCEPLISAIGKSGTSKWNYVAPFSKVSPWEKLLTFNTGLVRMHYGISQSMDFITNPSVQSKPGFGLGADFRYLFKNYESYKIGGSVGLGISYLSSAYKAEEYQSFSETTDAEKNQYYQIILLDSPLEKMSIFGLNVPLKLSYEKSLSMNNGFFMNIGAILSYYRGSYKFSADKYTSQGLYPQYNIRFVDDPNVGFKTENGYTQKGKLPINPVNATANIELGLYFKLRNNFQLYTGLIYDQALLNLTKGGFKTLITPDAINYMKNPVYNSFISESGNVNLSMIGITVSLKRLPKTASTQKIVNYLKQ
jgi:hypothetical protein